MFLKILLPGFNMPDLGRGSVQYFELWFHNVWTECWQFTDLFLSMCDLLKLQIMLNNFCQLWFFFLFWRLILYTQFISTKRLAENFSYITGLSLSLLYPHVLWKVTFDIHLKCVFSIRISINNLSMAAFSDSKKISYNS